MHRSGVDQSCTSSCEIDLRPSEARHFATTPSHRDAAMAEAVGIGLYEGLSALMFAVKVWRALHLPAATGADVVVAGARGQEADGSGGRREHLWLRFSHVPRLACAALHDRLVGD